MAISQPKMYLILLALQVAVALAFDSSQYDFTFEVIPGKYTVHSKVLGEKIRLALEVETTGWIGFGIAETGAMAGSDIVWGSAQTNSIVDAFAIGRAAPIEDLKQDWVLLSSEVTASTSVLEIERALVLDSSEDRSFTLDGATPIIVAYGDSPQMLYHGTSRARTSLNLYSGTNDVVAKLENMSTSYFDMRNNETNLYLNCSDTTACGSDKVRSCFVDLCNNGVFVDQQCEAALECKQCYGASPCAAESGAWVPAVETTYAHHCQDIPLERFGEQIIGFAYLPDPETQEEVLLHHFGIDLFSEPGCTGTR